MKTKLEPCPFCGGEMRVFSVIVGEAVFKCQKCGVVITFDMDELPESPAKVIETFNTRVAPTEPARCT